MKKLLLLIVGWLIMFAVLNAYALTINIDPTITPEKVLKCNMPVEREDGTPLALYEIEEVKFYSGTAPGDYVETATDTICQLTVLTADLPDGNYYKVASVVDVAGRPSPYSEEWVLVVKRVSVPRAPTLLE